MVATFMFAAFCSHMDNDLIIVSTHMWSNTQQTDGTKVIILCCLQISNIIKDETLE